MLKQITNDLICLAVGAAVAVFAVFLILAGYI